MSKFSWTLSVPVAFWSSLRARRSSGQDRQPSLGAILHLRKVACRVGTIVGILTLTRWHTLRAAIHVALNVSTLRRFVIARCVRVIGRIGAVVGVGRVARVVRVTRIVGISVPEPPVRREADAESEMRAAVATVKIPAAVKTSAAVGPTAMPTAVMLSKRGSTTQGNAKRCNYCQCDSFHNNLLCDTTFNLTLQLKFG